MRIKHAWCKQKWWTLPRLWSWPIFKNDRMDKSLTPYIWGWNIYTISGAGIQTASVLHHCVVFKCLGPCFLRILEILREHRSRLPCLFCRIVFLDRYIPPPQRTRPSIHQTSLWNHRKSSKLRWLNIVFTTSYTTWTSGRWYWDILRLTCQWTPKISGTYMGTYFIRENMSTRSVHNLLNIDPFLTRLVPLESSDSQLSKGKSLVKNGSPRMKQVSI